MKLFFILCLYSLLLIMQDFSEALSLSNAGIISMDGENTAAALYRKYYRPTFNCKYRCSRRCSKASRTKICLRACMACCRKCHCVPPGTYGNKEVCPCYARLRTHGNRLKCP